MGFDLGALGVAIASVLVVGLLLGAGIPLVYAPAIRSIESQRAGSNVIAGLFKFEKATYFEVNDPAVRQAPNVSFGEIAYRGESDQPGQFQQPPQQQSLPPVQRPDDELPDPQASGGYTPPSYAPPPQQGQPAQESQAGDTGSDLKADLST